MLFYSQLFLLCSLCERSEQEGRTDNYISFLLFKERCLQS